MVFTKLPVAYPIDFKAWQSWRCIRHTDFGASLTNGCHSGAYRKLSVIKFALPAVQLASA